MMTDVHNQGAASLTIDEVAEMHRVSRRTVERWISGGTLAARKLPGGLVRIDRTAAEALLSPVTQTAPPVAPQRTGSEPAPTDRPPAVSGGFSSSPDTPAGVGGSGS